MGELISTAVVLLAGVGRMLLKRDKWPACSAMTAFSLVEVNTRFRNGFEIPVTGPSSRQGSGMPS